MHLMTVLILSFIDLWLSLTEATQFSFKMIKPGYSIRDVYINANSYGSVAAANCEQCVFVCGKDAACDVFFFKHSTNTCYFFNITSDSDSDLTGSSSPEDCVYVKSNTQVTTTTATTTPTESPTCTSNFSALTFSSNLSSILLLTNKNSLVVGNTNGSLSEISLLTGDIVNVIQAHEASIRVLTLLHSNEIASGSEDNLIKIWNTATWQTRLILTSHTDWITCLVVLPNNDLISGSNDMSIKLHNSTNDFAIYLSITSSNSGHTNKVNALVVFSNGGWASGGEDTRVKLWNAVNNAFLFTITLPAGNSVYSLAAWPNSNYLAVGCSNSVLRVYNRSSGTVFKHLTGYTAHILSLIVLSNGLLVSGPSDGIQGVRVWNISVGTVGASITANRTFTGHTGGVSGLAQIYDTCNYFASVAYDGTIMYWFVPP